jgi:hypothetical protein
VSARSLADVRADVDEEIREAWRLTDQLKARSLADLRKLWAQHRPGETWPGVVKAPGKLAVTIGARGGP